MDEFEFLLADRLGVIRDTVKKYGEDKFYISYSGGKDSCVLSALVDMAIPNNMIPRVRVNTGAEYAEMEKFVREQQMVDPRIITIFPQGSFKSMLEEKGYPFKSKLFSRCYSIYQRKGFTQSVDFLVNRRNEGVPRNLKVMFEKPMNDFPISDKCCEIRKEKPMRDWAKRNEKTIAIIGLVGGEGGRRDMNSTCFVARGIVQNFYPLRKANPRFIDEFVKRFDVKLCSLYSPPYDFKRTGCKGCPFNPTLERDLKTLRNHQPIDYRHCLLLWGKVYNLYHKLKYRIKGDYR